MGSGVYVQYIPSDQSDISLQSRTKSSPWSNFMVNIKNNSIDLIVFRVCHDILRKEWDCQNGYYVICIALIPKWLHHRQKRGFNTYIGVVFEVRQCPYKTLIMSELSLQSTCLISSKSLSYSKKMPNFREELLKQSINLIIQGNNKTKQNKNNYNEQILMSIFT